MRYYVHCRIKPGGALQVLESLIRNDIRAKQGLGPIFTLYSDKDVLSVDGHKLDIITALPRWLNRLFRRSDHHPKPIIKYFLDYRNLMPLFPWLMKILSMKLKNYVLRITNVTHQSVIRNVKSSPISIMISSYAVAKNIDIPDGIHRTIYFHQPMHYIWTLYDEYVHSMQGGKRRLYAIVTPYLRRRDTQVRHYDTIYANSQSTATQISTIYQIPSSAIKIQHPPIDSRFFGEEIETQPDNYFFYINRLTRLFKHLDKIILLCNEYHIPLLIAGDGPDKAYLMSIAGPSIVFLGWVSDVETKISLMKNAQGIFNIAHESFGITTAEALLLGVPVFGYDGGATPELVDAKSGVLTPSLDPETLGEYREQFRDTTRDRATIQSQARKKLLAQQKFWG